MTKKEQAFYITFSQSDWFIAQNERFWLAITTRKNYLRWLHLLSVFGKTFCFNFGKRSCCHCVVLLVRLYLWILCFASFLVYRVWGFIDFVVLKVSWCCGFIAVSWFCGFRIVLAPLVSWCYRVCGFTGFVVSQVSWFHWCLDFSKFASFSCHATLTTWAILEPTGPIRDHHHVAFQIVMQISHVFY